MVQHPSRETLQSALQSWDRAAVAKQLEVAAGLRKQFRERFPTASWASMPVEEYGLGQPDNHDTACYWLEFKTRAVCSMSGGSSAKHLIYYSKKDGAWRFPSAYHSLDEAWDAVRAGFVEMLQLAGEGRYDEVDAITALSGSAALRTKTLIMYFPDELLGVTSKAHIEQFLRFLGATLGDGSAVSANRQLLELLRHEEVLSGLSIQELGHFLYHWADPRGSRVVKIAPGEKGLFWPDCVADAMICIGWDEVGDLTEFETKEAFREAFRERCPYNGNEAQVTRKSNELWTLMELQPGDKVIANRGISEVLGIGTVTDAGYLWRPERSEYKHTLGVDWDTSRAGSIAPVRRWATTTVAKVPDALYRTIVGGAASTEQPQSVAEVFLEIEEALNRRRQVILYGPPGTGKTYTARRAATWLLSGGSTDIDAAALLADDADLDASELRFSRDGRSRGAVWFMVADPAHWTWSQLSEDGGEDFSLGRLQRNYPLVRAGDLVVGYESKPVKEVVALARITGEYDPDGDQGAALRLGPLAAVTDGPTWAEMQVDPILAESEPMRFRCQGTLFSLTTLEADHLMRRLVERDSRLQEVIAAGSGQLTRVTFHPSYSYEDFVEGFRPIPSSAGQLDLRITDGLFKEACAAASADPQHPHVLIIDEINRGNIPKVFGELITLMEKDKRGLSLRLPQSKTDFAVPDNLWIIGTMNTADRSIHLLDTALRRRFAFVELLPEPELLEGATVGPLSLDDFLANLNRRIVELVGREKQVGHAVFYDGSEIISSPETFASVFRHELLPLLQEYLFEDYTQLAELLGEEVIDASAQRPTSVVSDGDALCAALARQFGAAVGA